MQPSNQQQVVWGNHPYLVTTSGSPLSQNPSKRNLWGSQVRHVVGIFQIICGITEFALGIPLLCLPLPYIDAADYASFGIWNGVFAVITGFLGGYSKRVKCMVIAYMVTSIIGAVLSSGCCTMAGLAAFASVYNIRSNSFNNYNGYDYNSIGTAHYAIYITLAVLFALQMVMSIIGASFTCGALTSTNNQQQIVYQTNTELPNQQFEPQSHYTALGAQPRSFNAAHNSPSFHPPTTVVTIGTPQ